MTDEDWVWSNEEDIEIANKLIAILRSDVHRSAMVKTQGSYVRSHFTTEAMAAAYYSLYTEAKKRKQEKIKESALRQPTPQ